MRLTTALALMQRESRGQKRRLAFFVACLAVGVAAVVAVAGLAASLDRAIRSEARQLLAADLAVEGRRPVPRLDELLAGVAGTERSEVKEMVTVVAAPATGDRPGRSRLVELKVVDGLYPFYGELRLDPDRPLPRLLDADSAVVAPEVLAVLDLAVGDSIRIGGESFRIAGTVLAEPDRVGTAFSLGPRVFLSHRGLERTRLEDLGSRIEYRVLIRLPDETDRAGLDALAERIEKELEGSTAFRVETYAEAQPALRRGLDRAERFLGLVALLSLLAGGIGVAQTVRAWIDSRMDSIAILACLGLRPRELLLLYAGQTAALGLLGSLVGALAGTALLTAAPWVLGNLIPPQAVVPWQPVAVGRGLALGVGVALLFSLGPLLSVIRVPPSRVLRRGSQPVPVPRWARWATGAVVGLGLLLIATVQSGSWELGLRFLVGLGIVALTLAAAASAMIRWLPRLVRRTARAGNGHDPARREPARSSRGASDGRVALRHGLAAISRPGSGTLGAVIALGLGVLVVLGMALVEHHLSRRFEADLPADAPTLFLIDIQTDQWPGVQELLAGEGAARWESAPVVMARLTAIDGERAEDLAEGTEGGRRWALTREQRLTYLDELPDDNRIIAGALWSDPGAAEVSVEREFARDLGLAIGSVIELDVQGIPVELEVTSLREVDWSTMGINFFLVAEPSALADAPQQRVVATRLEPDRQQSFQDRLIASFPNVTIFNVREIIEKVGRVLRRVGLGIRLLGTFTVLTAIAILAGAVSATSARRGQEVALLKTLGMTRGGVTAAFSVEYALIGLVAGLIGTAGGAGLAWTVITRGLELEWHFEPLPFAVALGGSVALAVVAGLAASLSALARRPIEALRHE